MSRDTSYFVVTSSPRTLQVQETDTGRVGVRGCTRSPKNKILKDYQGLNGISDRNQGRLGEGE